MKAQTNLKKEFGRIGNFLKNNGHQTKGENETVYVSLDENFICDRLNGSSQADAIKEHERQALQWYSNPDENPDYEFISETQTFTNACVLAIPADKLVTRHIRGSDIEEITEMTRDEVIGLYSVYNKQVVQPEEPMADHPHRWITYQQPVGSAGGIRGSERCRDCDICREYDTWKSNSYDGTNFEWTGYRRLTDEERESLSARVEENNRN